RRLGRRGAWVPIGPPGAPAPARYVGPSRTTSGNAGRGPAANADRAGAMSRALASGAAASGASLPSSGDIAGRRASERSRLRLRLIRIVYSQLFTTSP